MADTIVKQSNAKDSSNVSERGADEDALLRRAKRREQHQHWMRVMMEGQSTPDLTYQKPKI